MYKRVTIILRSRQRMARKGGEYLHGDAISAWVTMRIRLTARKISDERLRWGLFYYPLLGLTVPRLSILALIFLVPVSWITRKIWNGLAEQARGRPPSAGVALILYTRKTSRIYAFMRYTDAGEFLQTVTLYADLTSPSS